jgi:diguanylate cyclase (GGDEF)-like protein/PAS domain S-box-containing protein
MDTADAEAPFWAALPIPLVRLDPAGIVLEANPAARRLRERIVPTWLPMAPAIADPPTSDRWPLTPELRQRLSQAHDFALTLPLGPDGPWVDWRGVWQSGTAGDVAGAAYADGGAARPRPAHHLCVLLPADDWQQAVRSGREQALRAQWIADQMSEPMVYVDIPDGRSLIVNRRWAQAARRPFEALVGRRIDELLGWPSAERLQPVLDRVRAGEAALMPWSFPATVAGGKAAVIDLEFSPHRGDDRRIVGCLLTARARSIDFDDTVPVWDADDQGPAPGPESATAVMGSSDVAADDGLRSFVQASGEGLALQRDGVIVEVNRTLCLWLGLPPAGLHGHALAEFLAPGEPDVVDLDDSTGSEVRQLASLVDVQGRRRPVELREQAWLRPGGEAVRMTIVRDRSAELAAQAHIRHLTHHDALTGLSNRSLFMQRLDVLIQGARRDGSPLGLLFIDLDHFKRVNDLLGHGAGDVLLRTIGERLTSSLRSTDLVARFGGDEFMVLLPGRLTARDVEEVSRKLLGVIEQPVVSAERVFQVTPSIGVALFPQDGGSAAELIKNADTAMYEAKARGRAGVVFYDRDMGSEAGQVLLIESQLTQALARGELRMHLQPQVNARTGRPVGAEALIRWRHPERGWVPPDAFVPVAEQQRLIVPIGEWMLREAARHVRRWLNLGRDPGVIGVNLSAVHFDMPGFVDSVERLLRDEGTPGSHLELELTERMVLDDLPRVQERLIRLRALGLHVAVDDFGTGYSSLGHLKQLPVDKLKIDRLFVKDLPDNPQSAAILLAIVQMAHSLGMRVLAEGVENDAQRRFLAEVGCDSLQGHAVSPPLGIDEYEAWMSR